MLVSETGLSTTPPVVFFSCQKNYWSRKKNLLDESLEWSVELLTRSRNVNLFECPRAPSINTSRPQALMALCTPTNTKKQSATHKNGYGAGEAHQASHGSCPAPHLGER